MKYYLLKVAFSVLLQVLFFVQIVHSQTSPASYTNLNLLRKEMLHPTPTASALMRYVDNPVSYSTGVPEVTIPVYTIKSKYIMMRVDFNIKLKEQIRRATNQANKNFNSRLK